jgi:hypothetical protein
MIFQHVRFHKFQEQFNGIGRFICLVEEKKEEIRKIKRRTDGNTVLPAKRQIR